MNAEMVLLTIGELEQLIRKSLADLTEGCEFTLQVAEKLRAADCEGDREECNTCPVAQWLWVDLDLAGAGYVSINGIDARVQIDGGEQGLVEMPRIIREFVSEFDGGHYDELLREVANA